jgi:4-hydroxy-2-oxoglutarate aldolase
MAGSRLTIVPAGVYPPVPTFFDEREELDLATFQRHIINLAQTGISGYVVMGTNGEAVHLTSGERVQVIEAAREVAESNMPVIAGCGEQSTRSTIANCRRAAQAGADAALILPPSYYKGQMSRRALVAHYHAIADNSPLPIAIYNMPASAAGLDLDADTVCTLAGHSNIICIKDSAGDMVKLAQIVARVPASFRVFAGSAGYFLPALSVGAVGVVAALANVFPRQVCHIQELFTAGRMEEARDLQAALVAANSAVTSIYGVPGLKAALELTAGSDGRLPAHCGYLRSPLLPLTQEERARLQEIVNSVPQVAPQGIGE